MQLLGQSDDFGDEVRVEFEHGIIEQGGEVGGEEDLLLEHRLEVVRSSLRCQALLWSPRILDCRRHNEEGEEPQAPVRQEESRDGGKRQKREKTTTRRSALCAHA